MATKLSEQKASGKIQRWYIVHRLKGRGILHPTSEQIEQERARAEQQWNGGKYHRKEKSEPLKQLNAFTGEPEEVKEVRLVENPGFYTEEPLGDGVPENQLSAFNEDDFIFPDDLDNITPDEL